MTEVLLKELTKKDIDWMISVGHRQEIASGDILVREESAIDSLHIILDGLLRVTVSEANHNPLSRAFAAIEGSQNSGREVTKLSIGEMLGEEYFLNIRSTAKTVSAIYNSLTLSIPRHKLATKLQQDVGFASRFYRAIAIVLSDRLENIVSSLGRSTLAQGQAIRDVLYVLGELHDSDIDWIIARGTPQKIAANTILIREGEPTEALYLILDGTMSLSVSEDKRNPLTRAFAAIEGNTIPSREIARLSKGEIIGETPFIDSRLPATTVKTLEESVVLWIHRQRLATKLQQDLGFASRFYRTIATLLSHRLQGMYNRLGYGRRTYSQGQSLDEAVEYEDELDLSMLNRIALAGKRFDWMLEQLKVS
jgi:bacteriocin-type transport-associated protein